MTISRQLRIRPVAATIAFASCVATLAANDPDAERRALDRASRLARVEPGVRVALIDPDLAPEPELLRPLDAFVVRERDGRLRRFIYVNRTSPIVARAASGVDLDVLVLAAVIHHEARHLAGATEAEARHAELAFFRAAVASLAAASDAAEQHVTLLERAAHAAPPIDASRDRRN
jgi:hypothetical protein